MHFSIKIELTSEAELLRVIRAVVEETCQLSGFSSMDSSKIVLAVDEACSNIIKHTYKGKNGQPITIKCKFADEELTIKLLDVGEKVDPEKIRGRDLSELRPGGLGIHLIHSVMDEVFYIDEPGCTNCLVLKKRLNQKERY